jgi:hypothetical protein
MSVKDLAGTGSPGFVERIWPVIDVHRRLQQLMEAEELARAGVFRRPTAAATA